MQTVCAVIVTFNRKHLLIRCLEAIYRQTLPPCRVIIIDNASTDNTRELLAHEGFLTREDIDYHLMETNTGGAGGFHEGIKRANQHGSNYCWLMDDDGYPEDDCLKKLMAHSNHYDFYGPLVIDEISKDKLSFPIRPPGKKNIIRTISESYKASRRNIIENIAIPFNGIVLNLNKTKIYGLPKKEFFIWGDDIEYMNRVIRKNGKVATICNAKFYHPMETSVGTPMMFSLLSFNDTNSNLKLYCMCRNNIRIKIEYHGYSHALLFFLKCLLFYTITKPSQKKLLLSVKASWDGFRNSLNKHGLYLNENS